MVAAYPLAEFLDRPGHFVSDHEWRISRGLRMPMFQHPNVGAADAGRGGAQEDFVGSDFRHWNVLNAQVVFAEKAGSFHEMGRSVQLSEMGVRSTMERLPAFTTATAARPSRPVTDAWRISSEL